MEKVDDDIKGHTRLAENAKYFLEAYLSGDSTFI